MADEMPIKKFDEKFTALPPALRNAVAAVALDEILLKIAKTNALQIDQIGILNDIVAQAITGVIAPAEFLRAVEQRLNIGADQAIIVGRLVNANVFRKIREGLQTELTGRVKSDQEAPTQLKPSPHVPRERPTTPPPTAPELGTAPQKPEPLIIRPLPTTGTRDQALGTRNEGLGTKGQVLGVDEMKQITPRPSPTVKPAEPSRPVPVPKFVEPQAPVISPFGMKPPVGENRAQGLGVRVVPPVPKPAPPTSLPTESPRLQAPKDEALGTRDEALGVRAMPQVMPMPKPELPKPPAAAPATGPAPRPMTRDELQRQIEQFREKRVDSVERVANRVPPPAMPKPPAPVPPPLKLSQEKIPKPPAPEKYEVDPYKEAVE